MSSPESTNKLDNPYSARLSRQELADVTFQAAIAEASGRLGTVLHPLFDIDDYDREHGYFGFLDFDNTHPWGYDPITLIDKIEKYLRSYDKYSYLLGIIGYGNLHIFSPMDFLTMKEMGFKLYHVEKRDDFCAACIQAPLVLYQRNTDVADKLIIQAMCLFALDVGKPANIIGITSDADFATPIATLTGRGFATFVVTPRTENNNPALLNCSTDYCFVSDLFYEEGLDP